MARTVLLLTDLYRPVTGGLEGHVQSLGRELRRRGNRVAVATLAQPGQPGREDEAGVQIHRIDGWSAALRRFYRDPAYRFLPPVPDPGVVRSLAAIVRELRPDVLHAHAWMLYSALALPRADRKAVVMTLHDYGLACPKKTLVRHDAACPGPSLGRCLRCAPEQYGVPVATALVGALRAGRTLHGRVDRYLAVSACVRDRVQAYAGGRPVEVVPNFLAADVAATAPDPRPAFLPPDDGYVLYVGELGRHKGVDVLVDAHARLGPAAPRLVLIGRPVAGLSLETTERVLVVPGAPRADVLRAFARCAVAVVPSVWDEPCPTVALEAMSCGRPVVASHVGGLPDLVPDDRAGLLVPPRDPEALSNALARVLGDPALAARLGEGARAHARQFEEGPVVDRIEAAYGRAIEDAAARAAERAAA
jgi:glycosyltransferase involved in cell wall biosynthesis